MEKERDIATLLMHLGEDRRRNRGAVVPPIYQTSLFTFESWEAIDARITSYNVCYTKLLRIQPQHSSQRPKPSQRKKLKVEASALSTRSTLVTLGNQENMFTRQP